MNVVFERYGRSSNIDNLNLSAALSLPSTAAFLLNVKYPILSGSVVSKNFSMCPNKVCVLPVPGGPVIYIIVLVVH